MIERMTAKSTLLITSEFPPEPGGIGNHALNLALAMHTIGYQVKVIVFDRESRNNANTIFDKQLPFEVERVEHHSSYILMYWFRIKAVLKSSSTFNQVLLSGKSALWMQWIIPKRAIAIVHGSELLLSNNILRGLTNIALRMTQRRIAVSKFTKSLLLPSLQEGCSVIPNGVNLSEFSLEWKSSYIKIEFITIGTVHQRKGQHNFIAALPQIISQFPQCHYHVVGLIQDAGHLQELVKSMNLESYVTIHGSVSRDILIEKLKKATIAVMLSENTHQGDVEGFGISLLEANAMGVPALGSRGTGIEDAIQNQFNGILVDAKNAAEIADAIGIILNDYSSYSRNAVEFAKRHSWNLLAEKYSDCIDQ